MKEDELLAWLDKCWSLYKTSRDEWDLSQQAYKEIVALIKATSNLKNKSLGKLAEDLGVSFSAAKIISDHAQPKVTEEWIEEKAREIYERIPLDTKRENLKELKDFIRSLVEELK